jgi:hypothetical protein
MDDPILVTYSMTATEPIPQFAVWIHSYPGQNELHSNHWTQEEAVSVAHKFADKRFIPVMFMGGSGQHVDVVRSLYDLHLLKKGKSMGKTENDRKIDPILKDENINTKSAMKALKKIDKAKEKTIEETDSDEGT